MANEKGDSNTKYRRGVFFLDLDNIIKVNDLKSVKSPMGDWSKSDRTRSRDRT